MSRVIEIHGEDDFAKMRKAGRLAAEVLDMITDYVRVGENTMKLNNICHEFILDNHATSATLNYKGFPESTCISVNHVICHGIPSETKILKEGDVVNIDVTVIVDGYYGDTSRMYYAGAPTIKGRRLTECCYKSLMEAIAIVKPGTTVGDIGAKIQSIAEPEGFSVVRDYCGHGIGKVFHDELQVPHYGKKGTGEILKEGMIFTIEPMINAGGWQSVLSKFDGWTVTTKDKSLSAQFEHTMGVTRDGVEVFTFSPKGYTFPPYESSHSV
ncbi:MAG: type I methionyl aminopeptidase [Tannerellaceae bacterium]|nr:type I methionyl aminopeptidase [Tannerellaceae bacterium]